MFILCTNADGKYFKSGLEPLLYPTGCSFYRPFSYQEQWVEPNFLSVLKDANQLKIKFEETNWKTGYLGLRFKLNTFRSTFVPLRLIYLTKMPTTSDKVNLWFKLGNYIGLTNTGDLQNLNLDSNFYANFPVDRLLAEIPSGSQSNFTSLPNQAEFPSGLIDRLAVDNALPDEAKENFKNTTVLRLDSIVKTETRETLTPQNLQPNNSHSTDFGFELFKDKQYEFTLSYNRIYTPDESQDPLLYDYKFNSSADLYEVTKPRLTITGNYRTESTGVTPKKGQDSPTLMEWIGDPKTEVGIVANTVKIVGIQVPVKNTEPNWSSRRIRDLVIGSGLFLFAVYYFVLAYLWAKAAQNPDFKGEGMVSIFIGVGTFAMTWSTTFLNDAWKNKY